VLPLGLGDSPLESLSEVAEALVADPVVVVLALRPSPDCGIARRLRFGIV